MAKELLEFFQSKKQRSDLESAGIDWDKRREDWLSAVNDLYLCIEGWLSEPIRQGIVTLRRRVKSVEEPHLGT